MAKKDSNASMHDNFTEVNESAFTRTDFPVVCIGASAGGLEALQEFFQNMPPNPGAAFVIIQHLSPDYKSLMDELLARYTPLKIHRVVDGMPVEKDHLYLIPPRKNMTIFHQVTRKPVSKLSEKWFGNAVRCQSGSDGFAWGHPEIINQFRLLSRPHRKVEQRFFSP